MQDDPVEDGSELCHALLAVGGGEDQRVSAEAVARSLQVLYFLSAEVFSLLVGFEVEIRPSGRAWRW
ncbi:hypothetical protein [Streptomyces sp. NPDC056227]|uniref:hypothetical protein n=1 Tax=Streptomyces sp. NPDC056227 TaxID=3345753 RepID=UPI0035DADAA4